MFAIVPRMPTDTAAGKLIAQARQRRRLTQRQLAQHLGVSYSTVANWERGAAYPLRKRVIVEDFLEIQLPERAVA